MSPKCSFHFFSAIFCSINLDHINTLPQFVITSITSDIRKQPQPKQYTAFIRRSLLLEPFLSHAINAAHLLQMTNYSLEQSLFTLTNLDGAQRPSMALVETQSLAPKCWAEGLSLLTSFAMLMVRRQLPSYMEHGLSEFPKGGNEE